MNKEFNSNRYYDQFHLNVLEQIRVSKVLDLIGTNKSILDIGAGDGYITKILIENNNKCDAIEICRNGVKSIEAAKIKVYDIDLNSNWSEILPNKYDCVFAGEIIEHVFDTDQFLKNIKAVLNKDGFLVITTPNVASLGRRLLLLLGKSPLLETTARETDAGHIRYFTIDTLKQLLYTNDFEITEYSSDIINFNSGAKFYSKLLAKLFPRFGRTIIVKAILIKNEK